MTNENDHILDDLEVAGDDIKGQGPGVEANVAGQRVSYGENRRGGTDLQAGGVGVSSRETRDGTEYKVTNDGQDTASATIKTD